MNKLKPCPFCGKPARMKITKHVPKGYDYTPQCTDTTCCGRLLKKFTDEQMAYDSWNLRRAVDTDRIPYTPPSRDEGKTHYDSSKGGGSGWDAFCKGY